MYYAHASALRSASPARQVGAAILDEVGSILTAATNEMPLPGGGQFSSDVPAEQDRRQFRSGSDQSDLLKAAVLHELIELLKKAKWLEAETASKSTSDLAALIANGDLRIQDMPGSGSASQMRINQLIEFVPEVHAEMAALVDAARRGVGISGATLYTTTFPCHDCAKHIIASGIRRVVYWDPYPKSLVQQLYGDLVEIDGDNTSDRKVLFQRYIGLSPNRYIDLFLAGDNRKDSSGKTISWTHEQASFKLRQSWSSYIPKEVTSINEIKNVLDQMEEVPSRDWGEANANTATS